MAEPNSSAPPADQSKIITPAQRIAELNNIDGNISVLLEAASEAMGILANKRSENVPFATLEAQQGRFAKAANTYFSTLSSIEVNLKRQVYALEEAGLIREGLDKDAKRAKTADGGVESAVGGGPLDPSWLNARADRAIEHKLQREIIDEVKTFLASTNSKSLEAQKPTSLD